MKSAKKNFTNQYLYRYLLKLIHCLILISTTFSHQGLILLLNTNKVSAQQAPQLCATPGRDNSTSITGVINTYYPGTAISGTNITLGARRGANIDIQAGDLLVIMQMQGNNAGEYEYAVAEQISGNSLTVRGANNGALLNTYINSPANNLQGQQTFQVIRVPQYLNANISSNVTAVPWDGSSGGVVVFDVAQQLDLSGSIDVSGQGFRGGAGIRLGITPSLGETLPSPEATYEGLNAPSPANAATNIGANGSKGEGTAGTPRFTFNAATNSLNPDPGVANEGYPGGSFGRGAFGNAGGGATDGDPAGDDVNVNPTNSTVISAVGNDENSGGGGGANWGVGGQGGLTWFTQKDIGGRGGNQFAAASTRVIMGGGGGAGSNNDGAGTPPNGLASSGAAGGGIVLVRAGTFSGQGTVNASGSNAPIQLTSTSNIQFNDGGGGGGAGGSVIFTAQNTSTTNPTNLSVDVSGGDGSDIRRGIPHGPGGGGGGGFVAANVPLAPTTNVTGGLAGDFFDIQIPSPDGSSVNDSGNYGAVGGGNGTIQTSGTIPGIASGAECLRQPSIYKSVRFLRDNDNSGNPTIGDDLQYTLTIINPNAATIANISISDRIPAQLQVLQDANNQIQFPTGFQAASSLPTSSFNGTGQFIPLTNSGSLPANAQLTLIYNARILPGTVGQIENIAGIDLTPNDANIQPEILADASDSTNPSQPGSGLNPGIADANRNINQPNNSNADPTIIIVQTPITPGNVTLYGVKRITNVIRNGIPITGVDFSQAIDDPNDSNDNTNIWVNSAIAPTGVIRIDPQLLLKIGDEVEYTIYFLVNGNQTIPNARFCDPIPVGTSFIPNAFGSGNGISLNIANTLTNQTNNSDADRGSYFSPVAPLPANNVCFNQSNPTGAVLVNFGTLDYTPGNNAGFVRFRVRVE
ncbi:hypothetical protein NIES4101_57370 [Calothrix sp. NIES-4101]|nr:hypothetical protein NIES4101_57370 [Calothrix sp. NIES-4101]